MDFFIKKIFEDKIDQEVHLQFQKFSRGSFLDRAVVRVKNSKEIFSIGTTYEYANELVKGLGKNLGEGKTKVTGVVVSTLDLTGVITFSNKKQFMGIKQYVIDGEITGNELAALVEKTPKAFFALSFKNGNTELKIKPKSPKSAKPGSQGESQPKANFCKIKTRDKELVKGLLFDIDLYNFKHAEINHTFVIDEIILPQGKNDPAKIREFAKRKGKIIRTIKVDEKEMKKEKEFVA